MTSALFRSDVISQSDWGRDTEAVFAVAPHKKPLDTDSVINYEEYIRIKIDTDCDTCLSTGWHLAEDRYGIGSYFGVSTLRNWHVVNCACNYVSLFRHASIVHAVTPFYIFDHYPFLIINSSETMREIVQLCDGMTRNKHKALRIMDIYTLMLDSYDSSGMIDIAKIEAVYPSRLTKYYKAMCSRRVNCVKAYLAKS